MIMCGSSSIGLYVCVCVCVCSVAGRTNNHTLICAYQCTKNPPVLSVAFIQKIDVRSDNRHKIMA
jgi:hypothetical protein